MSGIQNVQSLLNIQNFVDKLGGNGGVPPGGFTWFYFSSAGDNPRTRQEMEPFGPYEREREDLTS